MLKFIKTLNGFTSSFLIELLNSFNKVGSTLIELFKRDDNLIDSESSIVFENENDRNTVSLAIDQLIADTTNNETKVKLSNDEILTLRK